MIQATLIFNVQSIEIKQDITDEFKLTWVRGDYSGSTSRSIAVRNKVTFNESFKCKCTMYVDKKTGKVRAKIVKFVLKRISGGEEKVFGKASVDVAPFFNSTSINEYSAEMETGRSAAPVVHFTFQFQRHGLVSEPNPEDHDHSGMGKNLDSKEKWDMTEADKPEKTDFVIPQKKESGLSQFKSVFGRPKERMSNARPSKELLQFMGVRESNSVKLFAEVLNTNWPPTQTQTLAAPSFMYPPSLFPIFSSLLHSGILQARSDITESVEIFVETLRTAPLTIACTNETRFITFMMIYVLTGALAHKYELLPEHIKVFQRTLKPYVDHTLLVYGKPLMGKIETDLNRFATAQFDIDDLMNDLTKTFEEIKAAVIVPEPIKTLVYNSVVAMVDARMVMKMLANPARLTFMNSMTWSSLVTGLETATGERLVLASEAARLIMVAPTVCKDPKLTEEVCPHFPKDLVLTIVKNVKPDEMMSDNIDVTLLVERYELDPTIEIQQVDPVLKDDYMNICANVHIENWNRLSVSKDLLARFPYMAKYLG